MFRPLTLVLILTLSIAASAGAQTVTGNMLPLTTGNRWVLKQASGSQMVTLEVLGSESRGSHLRLTTPYNTTDWLLKKAAQRYFLVGYGNLTGLAPVQPAALFFDFGTESGSTWNNAAGSFATAAAQTSVSIAGARYSGTIAITQSSGNSRNVYTFAPGTGLVRVVLNGTAFDLNPSVSTFARVPAITTAALPLPPIGLISNSIAGRTYSGSDVLNQLGSIASEGARLLLGYGRWRDLEAAPGHFTLDSLKFQVSQASQVNQYGAYTFCLIDMAVRNVPTELTALRWNDPQMIARVNTLLDAMAAEFHGRIKWIQIGDEVDTYFGLHPGEVSDYAELLKAVKARLASTAPGVAVSVTFSYSGYRIAQTRLTSLKQLSDLFVLTYGAYNADFSAQSPSAVDAAFADILQLAGDRKIFLQEISYPSDANNGSSPTQQALFGQKIMEQIRNAGDRIAGANFYIYADYPQDTAKAIATSAGLGNSDLFVTFLQSMGMFDLKGAPKPAWSTFCTELQK